METIYQILKKSKVGDTLTNGKLSWTVVDHTSKGDDCIIAMPVKSKKEKSHFELWGDSQSKITYMKNLSNLGKV